jgi:hypothetical protein
MDRDLPFTFIIGTPARHMNHNTTVGASISTRPAIKTAHTCLSSANETTQDTHQQSTGPEWHEDKVWKAC